MTTENRFAPGLQAKLQQVIQVLAMSEMRRTVGAPKILQPQAGEVVGDQQRIPQLGISLDPMA